MFYSYTEEYKHNRQNKPWQYVQNKTSENFKMSVTLYIDMSVMKWMFFCFNVFINHFLKIHRSALHKITIDLLYFWDVCDINLWEKGFGKSMAYSCGTTIFI